MNQAIRKSQNLPTGSGAGDNREIKPSRPGSGETTQASGVSGQFVRLSPTPPIEHTDQEGKIQQIITRAEDLGLTVEELLKALQQIVARATEVSGSYETQPAMAQMYEINRVNPNSPKTISPSPDEWYERICGLIPEEAVDLNELKNLTINLKEKTERIDQLIEQASKDPTKMTANYLEAAKLSGEMFREVSNSQVFSDGIKRLAWARSQHKAEFIKLMQNFSGELKNFIQKEQELLKKHNVSIPDTILKEGLDALENIKQGKDAPRTPINESLKILSHETCNLFVNFDKSISDSKKREQVKKVLVKAIMAGSACVVAIVNVMAGQDGTLTLAEATLSEYMAAGAIGAIATDVKDSMVALVS